MANTYTQLYFHIVFAVKGRMSLIEPKWKNDLYKYISGIITNQNQKLYIINGMPDHIHILLSTGPNINLSDFVRDVKANSSKWINQKAYVKGKFEWQSGFGAFTVSQSQLNRVLNYIKNQEKHHESKCFKEEYINFLKAYNVEYNIDYIFKDNF